MKAIQTASEQEVQNPNLNSTNSRAVKQDPNLLQNPETKFLNFEKKSAPNCLISQITTECSSELAISHLISSILEKAEIELIEESIESAVTPSKAIFELDHQPLLKTQRSEESSSDSQIEI